MVPEEKQAVTRELIRLDDYDPETLTRINRKEFQKRMAVRERYPDAEIRYLAAEQIKTKPEYVLQEAILWLPDGPANTVDLVHAFENIDNAFYLVSLPDTQYLVRVTSDYLESIRLAEPVEKKRFKMAGFKFTVGAIITEKGRFVKD